MVGIPLIQSYAVIHITPTVKKVVLLVFSALQIVIVLEVTDQSLLVETNIISEGLLTAFSVSGKGNQRFYYF